MQLNVLFENRTEAGKQLARRLMEHFDEAGAIVLGLPRGGVPVAFEVAEALRVPLDVFMVRKLGVPRHEELAMGAVSSGGHCYLNRPLIRRLHVPEDLVENAIDSETKELKRRENLYRKGRPPLNLKNKLVILVDDGLATGASMRAAVEAVKAEHPRKLVVAVPVAAPDSIRELAPKVDEIVCLGAPEYFRSVGEWYSEFGQTTDDEVQDLLSKHPE